MKIAFPVQADQGLNSTIFGHFGSAPLFMILNNEDKTLERVGNNDAHHVHGQCQPIKALGGTEVDVVVVGGIGAGALMKLQSQGIKVLRAVEGSVKDNLELLLSGKLPEFSNNMTCGRHQDSNGCQHH
jgi:predicted Fe-Mo cluster-binding NifX family protein